ncbi:MAG TPA: hypothetical protein VNJ01_08245 [Bacteriovoracaceae bacterium]|nr:hypothetical protein [Bacteriovoracaceae bacterium]
MTEEIIFADESLQDQVNHLRMEEYARASGFELDLTTLRWKSSDTESYVLVAMKGDAVIATMRGEIIDDLELLEKKLECPWDFPLTLNFPILLLSRAATSSTHRSEGLNMVLRYWFLKLAQFHSIPFVLGTFVSGSPRENSLKEMGYAFYENTRGWQQSSYKSHRTVQVVALDMERQGLKAISHCLSKVAASIEKYAYHSALPKLKFVRSL